MAIAVVAIITLSCVFLETPAESDADVYTTNSEVQITGVNVDPDFYQQTLTTSTDIQTLKQYFTVHANVDGSDVELSPDQFYLSTGGPLQGTIETITIVTPTKVGQDLEEETYEVRLANPLAISNGATLTGITVTGPAEAGKVFANSTEVSSNDTTKSELKNLITVTANFSDDSNHEIQDYSLDDWDISMIGSVNFRVQYGSASDDFDYDVTLAVTDSITEVTQTDDIFSSYNSNQIQNRLDVTVIKNDGKTYTLRGDEFSVSDDLYTGADGNDPPETITITPNDNPGVARDFPVTITPSTPLGITADPVSGANFIAFEGGDVSNLTVSVVFTDMNSKEVTQGITITYYHRGETENPVDLEDLVAGEYDIIVTYEENGESVHTSSTIHITVQKRDIDYPFIQQSVVHNYTGSELSWDVSYFSWQNTTVGDVIVPSIVCPVHGEVQDNSECQCVEFIIERDAEGNVIGASVVATEVGTYEVSFAISGNADSSYQWSDARPVTTYSLTITSGVPDINLDGFDNGTDGQWIFGDPDVALRFGATLQDSDPELDVTDQIEWSRVTLEYMDAGGNVVDSPNHAGEWSVRVTVPEEASRNLQATESGWLDFEIGRNKLSVVVSDTTFREGEIQKPTITVTEQFGSAFDGFTCGDQGYHAGTYDIEIVLTDTTSYKWPGTDGDTYSADWIINPERVKQPLVDDDTTITYDGSSHSWTIDNYGTYLDVTIRCSYHKNSTGCECMTLSEGVLSATDAGTYTISIRPIITETGRPDRVWSDGTSGPVTISITIEKKEIALKVVADSVTYGDQEPQFEGLNSDQDVYDLVFSDSNGTVDVGSQITGFDIDTDYDCGDDVGNYSIKVTEFTSRNYTLSSITDVGTLEVERAVLSISSFSVGDIVYGDPVPGRDDFILAFSGLLLDDTEADLVVSITTGYTPDSDAGTYAVTVTVSSDNYRSSEGSDDVTATCNLTVDPMKVYLDWTENAFQFSGSAPIITVMTAGSSDQQSVTFQDYVATWLGIGGSEASSFDVGVYILRLTIDSDAAANYVWDDRAEFTEVDSDDSDTLVVDVSITDTQVEIGAALSGEIDWTYGAPTNGAVLNGTTFTIPDDSGIITDDLRAQINTAIENGDYELVVDVSELTSGEHTIRFLFPTIDNYYVYADVMVTVAPYTVTVNDINNQSGLTYSASEQEVTIKLQNLGLRNGMVAEWNFTLNGQPFGTYDSEMNEVVFRVTEAGDYVITYSVTADNHNLVLLDNTFTISVSEADMTLTFRGSDGNGNYNYTYGGLNELPFEAPTASGIQGDEEFDAEWTFKIGDVEHSWYELMALFSSPSETPYSVTYTVEYENYVTVSGPLTFDIGFAEMSVTVSLEGATQGVTEDGIPSYTISYDGMQHFVSMVASGADRPLTGVSWIINEVSQTDWNGFHISSAGTLEIEYTVNADNHRQLTGSFVVVVTPATITTNVLSSFEVDYTGTANREIAGSASSSVPIVAPRWVWEFHVDGAEDPIHGWTALCNALIDAGTYNVTYSVTADNHNPASGPFTVTVNKADLDASVSPEEDTYDGDGYGGRFNESLSGMGTLENVDWTFDIADGQSGIAGWDALRAELVDAGIYHVTFGVTADNHNEYSGTFDVTINPKELTFDIDSIDITYGDDAPTSDYLLSLVDGFVGSYVPGGSVSINYSKGDPAGATNGSGDTYVISGKSLSISGNYEMFDDESFEVKKFAVTVTFDNQSTQYGIPYEGSWPATTDPIELPFDTPFYDVVIEDSTGGQVDLAEAINTRGDYAITGAITNDSYDVKFVVGTFTVGKREIAVTPDTAAGAFPFDGDELEKAEVLDLFDIDSEDDLSGYAELSFERVIGNNQYEGLSGYPREVGTYRVTFSFADDSDYSGSASASLSISPAEYGVSVYFNNLQVTYDSERQIMRISVSDGSQTSYLDGLTVAEAGIGDEADLTVTYTIDGGSVGEDGIPYAIDAGVYTVTATFHGSSNYVVPEPINATLSIEKKTLSATDISWSHERDYTYNGNDQGSTVGASYMDGDVEVSLAVDRPEFIHAGTGYIFTVIGFDSAQEDHNKNFVFPQGLSVSIELDIGRKEATLTANSYTGDDAVMYGAAVDYGYTMSGLLLQDYDSITVGVWGSPTAGTPSYSQDIYRGYLIPSVDWSDPVSEGDYDLDIINGDLQVTKRVVHVVVNGQESVYSGTLPAIVQGQGQVSVVGDTGFLISDVVEPILAFTDGFSGVDAGTYAGVIVCIGSNNPNYEIVMDSPGDLTIIPAPAIMTMTPYGGTDGADYNALNNYPVAGFRIEDSYGNLVTVEPEWTFSYAVGGSVREELCDVGVYTVTYTVELHNYTITTPSGGTDGGTFTVTIVQADNQWAYDGQQVSGAWDDGFRWLDYTYDDEPVEPTQQIDSLFEGTMTVSFSMLTDEDTDTWEPMPADWTPSQGSSAGTYRVTVHVEGNENFRDMDYTYEFEIRMKPLDPSWANDTIAYTGDPVTNTLSGYDPEYMMPSTQGSDQFDSEAGTMTAIDPGRHSVVLVLTDPNCYWADNEGQPTITLSWYISTGSVENHWTQIPSVTGWIYGEYDEGANLDEGSAQYGDVVIRFRTVDGSAWTSDVPTDAGDYIMLAYVPSGETEVDGQVVTYSSLRHTVSFTVSQAVLPIPMLDQGFKAPEYNGESQSIYEDDIVGFDPDMMSLSDNTARYAGEHHATVTLTDTNYAWEGTSSRTVQVTFEILKQSVDAPTFNDPGFEYIDGVSQSIRPFLTGFNEGIMTITGASATDAGTYIATVGLWDADNYRWSDGSVTEIHWSISEAEISVPVLGDTPGTKVSSVYSDGRASIDLHGYDPSTMTISIESPAYLTTTGGTFTIRALEVGTYSITINLEDPSNYDWIGSDDPIVYTWTVLTYGNVPKPSTVPIHQDYDGADHTFAYSGFDSEYMHYVGAESVSGRDAGTYSLTIALNEGFVWDDGSTEDVTVTWVIDPLRIDVVADSFTVEFGDEFRNWFDYTYMEGSAHIVEGDAIEFMYTTDATVGAPVGVYVIHMVVDGDHPNYEIVCHDGYLTIEPKRLSVTILVDEEEVEWSAGTALDLGTFIESSEPPSISVSGFTDDMSYVADPAESISLNNGTISVVSTGEGEYRLEIHLRDSANYQWAEGHGDALIIEWSVAKDTIDIAGWEFDGSDAIFTGEAIVRVPSHPDLVPDTDYTVSWSEDRTNVGTVTVTVTGIGTYSGTRTFEYEIVPRPVGIPASPGTFEFTGERIDVFTEPDPWYTASGDTYGTDVGEYVVTLHLTENRDGHVNTVWSDGTYEDLDIIWWIFDSILPGRDDRGWHYDTSEETYTGDPITKIVTHDTLIYGTDFIVTYDDNVNAGTVTVTVEGMGNYSGGWTFEFIIEPYVVDLGDFPLTYHYTGEEIVLQVPASPWYETLGQTTATDVGIYHATLHLVGNDGGHLNVVWSDDPTGADRQVEWSISKSGLPTDGWHYDASDETYTGDPITKTVTHDTLVYGTDFTVSYDDNVNAGTVTVTVSGAGSYYGSWTFEFTIDPYTVVLEYFQTSFFYTGAEIELPIPESRWISAYGDIAETDIGNYTAYLTLTANSNGYVNTVWSNGSTADRMVPWTISMSELPNADDPGWHFDTFDETYTGDPITKDITHDTLVEGRDYTVTYFDNLNVGQATVIVAGIGNYGGTLEFSFEITLATPTVVEWPNATSITRGDSLSESILMGGSATGVDGLDLEGTFVWIEHDIVPSVGTASFGVMFVPSSDNYASVQGEVGVTVNTPSDPDPPVNPDPPVDPDDPDEPVDPVPEPVTDIEFPEAGDITEGQTLADSVLTGGSEGGDFAWADPGFAPPVGDHSYLMVFTPTDGRDYSQVDGWDPETGTVQRYVDITVDPVVIPEPEPEDDGWSFPWWVLLVVVGMIVVGIAYRRDDEEEQ